MRLKVEDIPEEGLEVTLDGPSAGMGPILDELAAGLGEAELSGHLMLMPVEGDRSVWVTGEVKASIPQACSRCIEPVSVSVDEQVRVLVDTRGALKGGGDDEEIELDSESLDVTFYDEAEGIQIDQIVREQLLLGLPSVVLCRADCKGICQRCGADLNTEACRCGSEVVDPRFAVLASLKTS